MKVLVGTITGIVLGVAGVAVASNTHATTGTSVTPQVVLAQPAASARPVAQTAGTRVQGLSGQLTHKDTGAFELKVVVRQNGALVDRDVRVLVARAKVTNRLGQLVRLPLDDANARVIGALLPRSAWRLDDDGQLLPTFAATRVVLLPIAATAEGDQSDQAAPSGD